MNTQDDFDKIQRLCFDLLHHVYEARSYLTAAEIGEAISQPPHIIHLLVIELLRSGHLQSCIDNGTIYYRRPTQLQPLLPLPYHALDWTEF